MARCPVEKSTPDSLSWIDRELAGSKFRDERLGQRLRKIVAQLDGAMGEPIPLACVDWANTKAAYRFLSNEDVSEGEILAGHFASTGDRIRAAGGPILVLQDTTEFVYKRARPEEIGSLTYAPNKRNRDRLLTLHTVCGLLMHSSLAITTEGLPLGLVAIKFWTRSKFKGTTALKRRINPTRVPIEGKESMRWLANMQQSSELIGDPARCIHIGDRESDIYEFFCAAHELGTNFLVRACVDRLAGEGDHTITDEMAEVTVQAHHTVEIRTKSGEVEQAKVEIRYKRICVLPPVGKQRRYPALMLTVIHAEERKHPPHRAPVVWKLITNLEVNSAEEAIEKLNWYALRWKIEVFHHILKSGCKAEDAKLRTAERLVNLIAIFCLLSWRIFWTTMMNRTAPQAPPQLAFTTGEITILDLVVKDRENQESSKRTLSYYSMKVARLGGYLARAHDPPPGNKIMWRGWSRLADIMLGAEMAASTCG
jgi:hypothetical protein